MTSPVLVYQDFISPFIVGTGSSKDSVEVVLAQKEEHLKVHPIQYACRKMSSSGRNYVVSEMEAVVVTFPIRKSSFKLLYCVPFQGINVYQG